MLYVCGAASSFLGIAGVLFWQLNPTHLTTPEEVKIEAFQAVGVRAGKIKTIAWLRSQGFEIDEKNYQKNGNVVAILRDTQWGIPQTDIYFTLMFDTSKLQTNNPEWLGWYFEERTRLL